MSNSVTNQSEKDFFLDILTLGLVTKLKNTKTIVSLNIENRIPCNRLTISAWEQNNSITLPQDLKEFYASTDGFFLTWKSQTEDYKGERDSLVASGEVKINSLTYVRKLRFGNQRKFDDHHLHYHNPRKQKKEREQLRANQMMAFALSQHNDAGTICLVYHLNDQTDHNSAANRKAPITSSIWLLDTGNSWHFLADDFSSYFRMMLIHLGLKQWQLKFTDIGLTTSTKRIMTLLAPHLLLEDFPNNSNDVPKNIINTSLFKMGYGPSRTKSAKEKNETQTKKNST
ncbi:tubulin polyglutamylase complex subunit 2 [Planococcus citri]|uniref:tubulin polyglutamylase complex subunit 2 n=1 Tax=Planococcus citri TaxID=170843 RepID=UPI0031F996B1